MTLALAGGARLKVIRAMLSHASIVLTADTYTSVLPDVARHARKAIAAGILTSARRRLALIALPTRLPHGAILS